LKANSAKSELSEKPVFGRAAAQHAQRGFVMRPIRRFAFSQLPLRRAHASLTGRARLALRANAGKRHLAREDIEKTATKLRWGEPYFSYCGSRVTFYMRGQRRRSLLCCKQLLLLSFIFFADI
jgi:hypothetical protein